VENFTCPMGKKPPPKKTPPKNQQKKKTIGGPSTFISCDLALAKGHCTSGWGLGIRIDEVTGSHSLGSVPSPKAKKREQGSVSAQRKKKFQ